MKSDGDQVGVHAVCYVVNVEQRGAAPVYT